MLDVSGAAPDQDVQRLRESIRQSLIDAMTRPAEQDLIPAWARDRRHTADIVIWSILGATLILVMSEVIPNLLYVLGQAPVG